MKQYKKEYELFEKAIEVVREIGRNLVLAEACEIRQKGQTDFVTEMDVAIQTQICGKLKEIAPDYELIAEEKRNQDLNLKGKLWILDPIDGTTNFIHHFCHSGISLAMVDKGETVGGIVYLPFTDEMFTAFRGQGAYCNKERICVSCVKHLKDSLFSVGTNPGCRESADKAFVTMRAFYDVCHDIRRIGAASVELCYVASGRLDGYTEHGLKVWDYAAGALIVQEAGGRVTYQNEQKTEWGTNAGVMATNNSIHEEAMELLNDRCNKK